MERLIKSGLMFGNLVHVASPALVENIDVHIQAFRPGELSVSESD